MPTSPSPHLFDELDNDDTLSTRMLSEAFDADDSDPLETYAGRAGTVRAEEGEW